MSISRVLNPVEEDTEERKLGPELEEEPTLRAKPIYILSDRKIDLRV